MKNQIKDYIKKCPACQLSKTTLRNIKEPMIITTTSSYAFEKVFMDIVGPLPRSNKNNCYIITLQNDLTKYSCAIPSENHEANTVAHIFVTNFICQYGMPNSIVTDCGTEFLSKVFNEVCRLLKIKKSSTSPYHPQSNGSLERSHRTLGEYLRSFAAKDQLNWDDYIPFAMFAYNSSKHTSTGYQPFELVFGRQVTIPSTLSKPTEPQYNYDDYQFELKRKIQETQEIAKHRLINNKEKAKERYDEKVHSVPLEVGDKVYLENKASRNKLTPKWTGPFEILEIAPNNVNIVLMHKGKRKTVHRNLLKRHNF